MQFKVDDRVRVKDTAFSDSDDMTDIVLRGKTGTIAVRFGDNPAYDPSWAGCYEVEIDGDLWPLCEDELEQIQD